jgi:NAD-dependent dihydropyrimidine dehydrogenase PreA subunit
MVNRLKGRRFENDWTAEELKDIYSDITQVVTVPVNIKVKMEQRVLDLGSMEEILREADIIVLQDCGCRSIRGNCDGPLAVHINLDDVGDQMLESGDYNPRRVPLEEALKALRVSHEAGLVHLAYTMEGDATPKLICSCCPCCCHTLSGLLRFGVAKHVLKSDMTSATDADACTDCGVCAERCHFGARKMIEGAMVYNADQCFGCGLCVSTCQANAITLAKKG